MSLETAVIVNAFGYIVAHTNVCNTIYSTTQINLISYTNTLNYEANMVGSIHISLDISHSAQLKWGQYRAWKRLSHSCSLHKQPVFLPITT